MQMKQCLSRKVTAYIGTNEIDYIKNTDMLSDRAVLPECWKKQSLVATGLGSSWRYLSVGQSAREMCCSESMVFAKLLLPLFCVTDLWNISRSQAHKSPSMVLLGITNHRLGGDVGFYDMLLFFSHLGSCCLRAESSRPPCSPTRAGGPTSSSLPAQFVCSTGANYSFLCN